MASPNAVDAALIGYLAADATLTTQLPDGVFMDAAPPGAQRFVVVQGVEHEAAEGFTETLWERYVYFVRAVTLSTEGSRSIAGSDRIHALLHNVPLTVVGYSWMTTLRVKRDRYPELDPVDTDMRWQHRGGHYEVWLSPDS